MRRLIAALVLLAVAGYAIGARADEATFSERSGRYIVYLVVMPSEALRGPLPAELPGASPQRPPAAKDTHHVMVSIFDTHDGSRMNGLQVQARVAALGFSGEKRSMQPVQVGEAPMYGNSFPMLGRGPFRVDVDFSGPEVRPRHVTFYFIHPQFAPPPEGAAKGKTQ